MFSEKATKIDEIFTIDLTVTTYCQINGEYCVNFCGLLRKHELYLFSCMLKFYKCNLLTSQCSALCQEAVDGGQVRGAHHRAVVVHHHCE